MTPKRVTYHVTPTDNGEWKTKRIGADRAAGIHEDKSDAVAQAKELAKGYPLGQVVVHDSKGKIQYENTYKKDPYPPRG